MDVGQILTIAFGIVGSAGALYAYFRKSAGDSTIKYQADSIDALTTSNTTLREQNAALISQNETLKQSNTVLQGLAQGSPKLTELAEQIKELVQVIKEDKQQ